MDSIKQRLNHAYEMLSCVQLEGKYAKRFGKAMQDLEEAYVETEKAERELITLRKELSEKAKKAKKARETETVKAPAGKEETDG